MSNLNVKTIKKIRRFGKLRFFTNPLYSEKKLLKAYKKADNKMRREFDKEMNIYLQAIHQNKIKPGESIIRAALSVGSVLSDPVPTVQESGDKIKKEI
jgi:hypothetical protein